MRKQDRNPSGDGGEQVRVVRGRGGHLGVTCELMALAKFLLYCPGHGDVVAHPQDEQCQQTSLKPSLRWLPKAQLAMHCCHVAGQRRHPAQRSKQFSSVTLVSPAGYCAYRYIKPVYGRAVILKIPQGDVFCLIFFFFNFPLCLNWQTNGNTCAVYVADER